jgi:hypothetical protein
MVLFTSVARKVDVQNTSDGPRGAVKVFLINVKIFLEKNRDFSERSC